ncbi:MAG: hypothetical protein QHH04_05165 [Methanolinea sp.]|nr:hypothetical protein [Methanolinea sp.]
MEDNDMKYSSVNNTPEKFQYKIVNIVASVDIGFKINLSEIYSIVENTEYDPEFYHALKYRIMNPKSTILVNKNGKIIICGVKTLEEILASRDKFFIDLARMGYNPTNTKIKIENLVFCCDTKKPINLLKFSGNNHFQYNPKKFRGVVFKNIEPKFTATIFQSGKFNVTGLCDFDNIPIAIEIIEKILGYYEII